MILRTSLRNSRQVVKSRQPLHSWTSRFANQSPATRPKPPAWLGNHRHSRKCRLLAGSDSQTAPHRQGVHRHHQAPHSSTSQPTTTACYHGGAACTLARVHSSGGLMHCAHNSRSCFPQVSSDKELWLEHTSPSATFDAAVGAQPGPRYARVP